MTSFDKNQDFLSFIKNHNMYHEKSFDYIKKHSTFLNFDNSITKDFIGCFYDTNQKGYLINLKLYVPYIKDKETLLINIHEYTHALYLYEYLNQILDIGLEKEAIPLLMERIYKLENPSIFLNDYFAQIYDNIKLTNNKEYILGIEVQNELLESYQAEDDILILNQKAKYLIKKHNHNL